MYYNSIFRKVFLVLFNTKFTNGEQVKVFFGLVIWASHTLQNETKMWHLAEDTKASIVKAYCLLFICALGVKILAEMKGPGTKRFSFLVFHSQMLRNPFFFSSSVPGNLGCYKDHGNPPPLTGASKTSNKLTIQTCISFCRSQRFKVMVLFYISIGKDKDVNAFC